MDFLFLIKIFQLSKEFCPPQYAVRPSRDFTLAKGLKCHFIFFIRNLFTPCL